MSWPQHVLMTADTIGGVWTYALELSRALGSQGVAVSLATMGRPLTRSQREEARKLPGLEFFESSYRLEWMNDPWHDVSTAGEWLLDLERRLRPDLVHLNGYVHGALPWNSTVVVAAHSCVLSWWQAVHGSCAPPEWEAYRSRVAAGIAAADHVVGVSRFMLQAIGRWYGVPAESSVVYNARQTDAFAVREKRQYIACCGRVWDEAKNIRTLDNAAAQLPWPVYVAGERQHPEGGLAPLRHARALGYLPPEEMRELFSHAPVFASAARYEPFGLTALEAALCGCALVLSDIPSFGEIWQDAALFVPADDADALANALNTLIADADIREDLARKARQRARCFDMNRMLQGYLEVYSKARSAWARRAAQYAETPCA